MKSTIHLVMTALLIGAIKTQAQPSSPVASSSTAQVTAAHTEPVNYFISVTWEDSVRGTNTLQLVTSGGSFELNTVSGSTKVGDREVPNTVKLSGTLRPKDEQSGSMQLFVGRTVPYATSDYTGNAGQKSVSYSTMSVGLNSNVAVTFGKPLRIQSDNNGAVILLVKRQVQ